MIKRHWQLWRLFLQTSLMRDLEYKGNFIIDLVITSGWMGVSIFAVEMLFTQTQSLAGWNKAEVLLIYSMYRLCSSATYLLVQKNTNQFSRVINSGELDLLLTKPVNTLFLTMFRFVSVRGVAQIITALLILTYSLSLLPFSLDIGTATLLIILSLLAAVIRLCLEIIVVTPIIWLQKLENVQVITIAFFTSARFPRAAFPKVFQIIFSFLMPIFFVGAIPAEIILGKSALYWVGITILMTIVVFIGMRSFFAFALKHYSSASS